MTQVLIDRELLERAVKADASIGASSIALVDGWKAMAQIRAILAQPAQQGEAVEVRGLQWLDTGYYQKKPPQFGYNPHDWNPLMSVAQHQRILAGVRQQLAERDAAIEEWSGTAVQNGMECDRLAAQRSIAELREELDAAGEIQTQQGRRNTELRAQRDTLRQQRDKLAELLREARLKMAYMLKHGEWYSPEELIERIDAALSELTP